MFQTLSLSEYLVVMLEHVSNLNVILQGRDLLVHELHTVVQDFKTKPFWFLKQVKINLWIFLFYKECT